MSPFSFGSASGFAPKDLKHFGAVSLRRFLQTFMTLARVKRLARRLAPKLGTQLLPDFGYGAIHTMPGAGRVVACSSPRLDALADGKEIHYK